MSYIGEIRNIGALRRLDMVHHLTYDVLYDNIFDMINDTIYDMRFRD